MRSRRKARALLALGSLLISLLAAEIVLRLVEPADSGTSHEHRIPHPSLGWVLEPGASFRNRMREATVRVSYNAEGWRDVEHARARDEGVLRLIVLGDSFMEGYSVELEDSLPRLLEGLLREAGRRAEVVNLGVGGYGTLQQYLVFDEIGRHYRPDLVLLGFYVDNDVQNNSRELERMAGLRGLKAESRPYLRPGGPSDWSVSSVDYGGAVERYEAALARRSGALHRLGARSALVRRIARKLDEGADRRFDRKHDPAAGPATGDEDERLDMARHGVHACREPEPWTRAWETTRRILSRLEAEVEATGARLVVFSVPSVANVVPEAAREIERESPAPAKLCLEEAPGFERLAGLCREMGITYLDLLPAFRSASREEGAALFRRSDRHWAEAGHRLAAELVAAQVSAGLVSRPCR